MPLYFFDIHDGDVDLDDDGVVLPGLDVARAEAIKFAGAYVSNNPSLLDYGQSLNVEVLDADRRPLYRITITVTELGERQNDAPSSSVGS